MPNNEMYNPSYNISGIVQFIGENVQVKVSDNLAYGKDGNKKLIPNFQNQEGSQDFFVLNVNNQWSSNTDAAVEGSVFIRGLRQVRPFEAYMTTSENNAKRAFFIEFSETTGIDEMPSADNKGGLYKVFNLNGQLVKKANTQSELDETLKQLPTGVYIINGKKTAIKR
jgi:hypothetical protein